MTKLIGLVGTAGSGKDTVAAYLKAILGARNCEQRSFATPLKEAVLAMFRGHGVTHEQLYGPSELRESQIGSLTRDDGSPLTVRYVLQTMGTELGRQMWHKDIWLDLTLKAVPRPGTKWTIITDCRFANECTGIAEQGGELWHVVRPTVIKIQSLHQSELDFLRDDVMRKVTYTLQNTSTIENLFDTAYDACRERLGVSA